MKKLLVISMILAAVAAQAQTVFYGGDFDGRNGLASQINGPAFTDVIVYDNFSLGASTNITGVFGNFQDSSGTRGTSLYWEIRSGMSAGNGGTVVASGLNAATSVFTGNIPFGTNEYLYNAGVTSFVLGAGSYHLGVAVNGGDGNAYASTANGTGGVGGPLGDGNSFINSASFGINYEDAALYIGDTTADFSIGLKGTAVPEPASMAVLGLGAAALLRRRRKA